MQIKIELFGSVRLYKNEKPVNISRKKTKSLLAYLILNPNRHARERLIALFWGDSSETDARRALRVSLTEIRAVFGDSVFITEQDWIQINPSVDMWIDVLEFHNISKWTSEKNISELQSHLKLYSGDFMQEYYDEWVIDLREKYLAMYVSGLLQGANAYRTAGDYKSAIDFSQQVLQVEPVNETAYQHILVCLAAQGEIDAAIKQYEKLKQKLFTEFDSLPSPEIQKLYETLQKQKADSSAFHHLTNIPQATTSFIGRQDEIEKIKQNFESHIHQSFFLNLKGPGGVGKSRLALETARQLLRFYPDGVWWVDLAQISESRYVANTVARITGVKEKPNQEISETIGTSFQNKKALLILDNCEHVLNGCASLVEILLRTCQQIHILSTSREPLNTTKEKIFVLHAMPLPKDNTANTRALINNEAVKLFVERASFKATGFQATDNNLMNIAEICKKLDGFPLAIELIATQAQDKKLEEIKNEIVKFEKKKKQLTLQNTIQWSYDLLNETEQALFRRLSIFAGYWTEEQAIQIAGGYIDSANQLYPQTSLNQNYVLPISAQTVIRTTLLSLVAKSLISIQSRNDNMQFLMLDTIRQFAFQKLREQREYPQSSLLHAQYYLNRLNQFWGNMYTSAEKQTLDTIETDYDNIRLALSYALKNKDITWTKGNLASLGRFWVIRSRYREGREWFTKILKHPSLQKKDTPRATAFNNVALIAWDQGDHKQARTWYENAMQIQKKIGDKSSLSLTLNNYGNTYYNEGQYKKALPYYEESLKLARATKNERALNLVLNNLSAVMMELNDMKRAETLLLESLKLRKKAGDKRGLGHAINNLGDLNAMRGNLTKARKYFFQGLQLQVEVGDQAGYLNPILNLANLFVIKKIKLNDVPQLLGFVEAKSQEIGKKLSHEAVQAIEEIKKSNIELIGEPKFTQKYNQGKKLNIQQIVSIVKNE
ncbi:MAG: tetratricopeptide repeat protein [Anaerolineales bacterium]|nr:tetratricopeptide repeat protein [Anaerolineales bacterium]